MPIHSLELRVWKRLGDGERVLLPPAVWQSDRLPSGGLFLAAVEVRYEVIELPWFPDGASAYVETDDRMVELTVDEPVAPAFEIALQLWHSVRRMGIGTDQ